MFSAVWSRDCAAFFYSTRLLLFRLVFRSLVKRGFQYNRARAPPVQFEPKTQIERRIKLKTTFLVRKIKDDAKSGLVRVSAAEWTKILKENKNLPTEQKRYFIIDCIDDDRMYIEVSLEEHRDWNIRHTISERNRKFGEKFSFCSLEQDIIDHEGIMNVMTLGADTDFLAEFCYIMRRVHLIDSVLDFRKRRLAEMVIVAMGDDNCVRMRYILRKQRRVCQNLHIKTFQKRIN